PPAPCSREQPPTGAHAAAPLPRSLLQFRRRLKRCSTPPAASRPPYPRVPAPPPRAPPGVRLTAPQSPPTQSGSPGSSPDYRSAPKTQCCRPEATAPSLPCGTSALPARSQTDPAQTAPPSAPAGSDTPAPLPLHRRTSPPPPRPALVPGWNPVCTPAGQECDNRLDCSHSFVRYRLVPGAGRSRAQ